MIRRDFCKTSLALAGLALRKPVDCDAVRKPSPADELPKAPGLTKYVSEFIVNTKYEDIPENVIALGKKTILDGFGLRARRIGFHPRPASSGNTSSRSARAAEAPRIIGTKMKVHPRFAALANGISIHADDFDDTGSAFHVAAPDSSAVVRALRNRPPQRQGSDARVSRGRRSRK